MIIRRKIRYVLVEASREINLGDKATVDGFQRGLDKVLGDLHYADAGPKVVAQYSDRSFVVRVNRGTEDMVVLAMAFMKEINGQPIGFYTIRTSGTIATLAKLHTRLYS